MKTVGIVAAVLALAACAGDDSSHQAAVATRDSAGVTIVEFDTSAMQLPVWTVGDTPTVAIGMVDGPPEYTLERVQSADLLAGGRILVVDGGSAALRWYDTDGVHVRSVGRKGSGPGEFQHIYASLRGPGDSIYVYDGRLRRLSVFDTDGGLARTIPLTTASELGIPRPVAVLPDGRIVVTEDVGIMEPPGGESRVERYTRPLSLHAPDGRMIDTVGSWPGNEVHIHHTGSGLIVGPPVWGATTTYAALGSDILVADSERWELRIVAPDGTVRRIIRGTMARQPVAADAKAAYRSGADDPQMPERFRERIRTMPLPDSFPAFDLVFVGDDGTVWVSDYRLPGDEGPLGWLVIGEDGPVARAFVPRDVLPVLDAAADRIVGVRRDEFLVPQVVVLPLRRPRE